MAQTTIELRHVLELDDFELFDFEYPCQPGWKENLEQAIIDYYYFDEIGQESIDRFKHRFKTRFTRIMGYYNELYKTTVLEGNPLTTTKVTEVFAGSNITAGQQDQTAKNTDYPQTGNPLEDIPTSKQDMTGTNEQTTDNEYTKTTEGYNSIPFPELLKMHRETILRINTMIIEELKPCFILVY
ncbi:MAG: hypothetical protein GX912_12495 [Gammaproteobacteria bacterium]|mgnify:CR=1 FL=1|nr:hypothetical protein [Gammaproteobacteria bacterium]